MENFKWCTVYLKKKSKSWVAQGKLNSEHYNELLKFRSKNIQVSGFYYSRSARCSPLWLRSLHGYHLIVDIQKYLWSLLSWYKDQSKHLDLNNEILHGSFDLEGIIGLACLEKHIKVFLNQIVIDLMHQHHVVWKYRIYMWSRFIC
jgi:hypothetical protein